MITRARMQELRQWVCWRYQERNGKLTKVPFSPLTGGKASSTDPSTWGTYSEAVEARRVYGYAGIGFVFTTGDPYCGVDLDGCVDPESGEVEPWAQELVDELDSYTEISPSGRGLHVICRGELPPGRNRVGPIEMYESGRYFTVTGRRLRGTPRSVEERTDRLGALAKRVFSEAAPKPEPQSNGSGLYAPVERSVGLRGPSGSPLTDDEIIERAEPLESLEATRSGAVYSCDSPAALPGPPCAVPQPPSRATAPSAAIRTATTRRAPNPRPRPPPARHASSGSAPSLRPPASPSRARKAPAQERPGRTYRFAEGILIAPRTCWWPWRSARLRRWRRP